MIKRFIRFINSLGRKTEAGDSVKKNTFVSPIAVARWSINQFVTCPFCNHDNNIIEINLRRKVNQGRMTVHQKQVSKYDKNKFEYQDVSIDIPTPPYFGALNEDTENLDERIDCEDCGNTIHIHAAHWNFGSW
jgi:hypothetical protein